MKAQAYIDQDIGSRVIRTVMHVTGSVRLVSVCD
jgi:hypothetical protein